MSHIPGRIEMHTEFWWGNLKEEDYFEVHVSDALCVHLQEYYKL